MDNIFIIPFDAAIENRIKKNINRSWKNFINYSTTTVNNNISVYHNRIFFEYTNDYICCAYITYNINHTENTITFQPHIVMNSLSLIKLEFIFNKLIDFPEAKIIAHTNNLNKQSIYEFMYSCVKYALEIYLFLIYKEEVLGDRLQIHIVHLHHSKPPEIFELIYKSIYENSQNPIVKLLNKLPKSSVAKHSQKKHADNTDFCMETAINDTHLYMLQLKYKNNRDEFYPNDIISYIDNRYFFLADWDKPLCEGLIFALFMCDDIFQIDHKIKDDEVFSIIHAGKNFEKRFFFKIEYAIPAIHGLYDLMKKIDGTAEYNILLPQVFYYLNCFFTENNFYDVILQQSDLYYSFQYFNMLNKESISSAIDIQYQYGKKLYDIIYDYILTRDYSSSNG